jgi:hypothetical protein
MKGKEHPSFLGTNGDLPGTMVSLSFASFMVSSGYCYGNCQLSWHWGKCHLALKEKERDKASLGQVNSILWFQTKHFSNYQHIYMQSWVESDPKVKTAKETDTIRQSCQAFSSHSCHLLSSTGPSEESVLSAKAGLKSLKSNLVITTTHKWEVLSTTNKKRH